MTKRMKKAFLVLAMAFVMGAFGLGSGAAFEAAIAPDQVRAVCEDDNCDGASSCRAVWGSRENCSLDENSCTTSKCGVE